LTAGFPDALDLIVICVEAGLGLGPAIQRVGQELQMPHPELSEEFHLLSVELRTGMPRPQALRNFANRTGLEDVKTLVAILIQTDRFGTSIGDALRVHSDSMRKTRQFRAEELAAKLPVKMLFPLIFFIFPSFFVVILGPALLRIIRFMLPALSGH
jgi:tight adherence protein C